MSSVLGISRRLPMPLLFAFAFIIGCDEESTQPVRNDWPELLPLTSPENVISNLVTIYNDKTHSKEDRLTAYASLFDSAFVFHFRLVDIGGGSTTWGLEDELAAHDAMFGAQAAGNIYSLELRIIHNPPADLNPPEQGREGWKEIFATNVYLRLMENLEDGFEVNGGQAEFKFPPAENGRFRIAEWTDLPRPEPIRDALVDPTTWGEIKAAYR